MAQGADKPVPAELVLGELVSTLTTPGLESVLAGVCTTFVDSAQRLGHELETAAHRQDLDAVRRVAHTLLGSSSAVAVAGLQERLALLEAAAESGDPEAAVAHVPQVLALLDLTIEAVTAWMGDVAPPQRG